MMMVMMMMMTMTMTMMTIVTTQGRTNNEYPTIWQSDGIQYSVFISIHNNQFFFSNMMTHIDTCHLQVRSPKSIPAQHPISGWVAAIASDGSLPGTASSSIGNCRCAATTCSWDKGSSTAWPLSDRRRPSYMPNWRSRGVASVRKAAAGQISDGYFNMFQHVLTCFNIFRVVASFAYVVFLPQWLDQFKTWFQANMRKHRIWWRSQFQPISICRYKYYYIILFSFTFPTTTSQLHTSTSNFHFSMNQHLGHFVNCSPPF